MLVALVAKLKPVSLDAATEIDTEGPRWQGEGLGLGLGDTEGPRWQGEGLGLGLGLGDTEGPRWQARG